MKSHDYVLSLTANIDPAMRYKEGADFDAWHTEAKAKLATLLGLDKFIIPSDDEFSKEASEEKDGLTYIRFTFQSEEGYFVPCCLVKKSDAQGKLPVCICLQGHSSGMHISLGEEVYPGDAETIAGGRDFAVRAAKEGMLAIAVEQRYMGKLGYDDNPTPACCAVGDKFANQAMPTLLIGRTPIGERVWDISRTIDALCKHFADMVDEDKIICMGNSGGGTATFYASCMEDRIAISVPSCAVCTYEASIMAMNHCPCNFVPGIRRYFNMGDLGMLIAPRKFLLVCGKDDPIFPLAGVKESFDIIKTAYEIKNNPEDCNMVIGGAGHQFYPDDAWPVIHEYLAR